MFPFNYFKYMWSSEKIFGQQHEFNGFQNTVVLIFWSVVMLLPMVTSFTPVYDFDESQVFMDASQVLPTETSKVISQQDFDKGAFEKTNESFNLEADNALVSFLPPADDVEGLVAREGYLLLFLTDSYSLRSPSGESLGGSYAYDFFEHLDSNESMLESMAESYYEGEISQQRTTYLITRHFIFMVFGIGALMMITARLNVLRRQNFWDIFNFSNGFSMVAMASGVPSLLATLVGFIYSHNVLMLMVQILGTLVMLWLSYRKTKFKIKRD